MIRNVIAILAMAAVSVAAYALPAPKQIERALEVGNYTEARGMVQEVLREKPESARAHLLNAYIIAKADGNKEAAANELNLAAQLDKVGDVKNSSLFGRTTATIEGLHSLPVVPQHQAQVVQQSYNPAPVQDDGGHPFFWFMFWLLIVVGILYVIRRVFMTPIVQGGGAFATSPSYARGTGTAYAPVSGGTTVVQSGSGVGSTVLGVAGGVVAGELMADALLNRHGYNNGGYNNGPSNGGNYSSGNGNSFDTPASALTSTDSPVSTEARDDSFSSGSDDSWSSSAPTKSDDSWNSGSSSSSDYSSGSDSGSSWDSGSSSGGGDSF